MFKFSEEWNWFDVYLKVYPYLTEKASCLCYKDQSANGVNVGINSFYSKNNNFRIHIGGGAGGGNSEYLNTKGKCIVETLQGR